MLPPATGGQLDALIVRGGSGTAEDVAVARAAAARLPRSVAGFLIAKRARIVACRNSITDHETSLRGVRPRGWPPGQTWDIVPGVYLPARRQVVVATVAGPQGRTIPPMGQGHGSVDLLLHEAMHGHDFLKRHKLLRHRKFRDARTADIALLGDYERQEGDAGLQETYAESAARSFAPEAPVSRLWPTLAAYWQTLDQGALELPEAAAEGKAGAPVIAHDAPIGTASFQADGSLLLDLRADGPDGAIGHALVRLTADSAAHRAIVAASGRETPGFGNRPFLVQPFG